MSEEENTPQQHTKIDTSVMKMPGGKIHHSHLGPILGILLIVLVVIAVGLYLWGANLVEKAPATDRVERTIENNEPETPRANADMQILGTVSSSNEISAIEADVMSTNLDSLDSDIADAERELLNASKAPQSN